MQSVKIPKFSLLLGVLVLIGLIVFVYLHVGDTKRFVILLSKAKPIWLALVIGLQVTTYLSVGIIWYRVLNTSKYHVSLGALARLSIEKLSVDQFIPALGISGNLIVYQAMKRLKLPKSLALEAILINILAHYIAYAVATASALFALWFLFHVTAIILTVVGLFTIILIVVPMIVLWLVRNKDKQLPKWLSRFQVVTRVKSVLKSVSPDRIYAPGLLVFASIFNLIIFLLDSSTLWAVMKSLSTPVSFITAFIALVLASVAATLSALPGGIGGFEAGSMALLTLMGVPLEAAFTGTLILRGFTMWLPLLPGLYLARKDASKMVQK